MSSKWLRCVYQKSSAEIRLICFPWAGGGAAFYANWGKKFAGEIEGLMLFYCWRFQNRLFQQR